MIKHVIFRILEIVGGILFFAVPLVCFIVITGTVGAVAGGGELSLMWRVLPALAALFIYALALRRLTGWDV